MSYAYRIKLPDRQAVVSEEGVWRPELFPLLPESELHELVTIQLRSQGWSESADGSLTKELSGVTCRLSKDTVEVSAQLSTEVTASKVVIADSDDSDVVRDDRIRAGKTAQNKDLSRQKQETRRNMVSTLLTVEKCVNQELDEAMKKVYPLALERKAAQLGEIEAVSTTESEEDGLEVVIKVNLR